MNDDSMTSRNSEDDGSKQRSMVDDVAGGPEETRRADDQTTGVHRPPPAAECSTWTTGEQYGVGTAAEYDAAPTDEDADPSRVWFTLTEGALSEPRFPRVDLLQFRLVDVLVTDHGVVGAEASVDSDADQSDTGPKPYVARTHNETRLDDERETIERSTEPTARDAPVYRQTIAETGGSRDWTLEVEYVTDPDAESILLDVAFHAADDRQYDVFVVAEPTIDGYIEGTVGEVLDTDDGGVLIAYDDGETAPEIHDGNGHSYGTTAALAAGDGFESVTVGHYEQDRLVPLLDQPSGGSAGEDGRVLIGQVGTAVDDCSETLVLGFAAESDGGTTGSSTTDAPAADAAIAQATESLDRGFDAVRGAYVEGWEAYVAERPVPDVVADDPDLRAQYSAAIQCLRAVEDKTFHGAGVASPSVPWGDNVDAASPRDYGYNFTWSRDLYQVFTALSAVEDLERARLATEYLYTTQQREDGFLPQNTYLDGRTRWGGEQLDNIAYPAVMAYQLDRVHDVGFEDVAYDYAHVRRSIEYVLRSGPRTEQERWEEEAGYSPSTIAAMIAGLGCAAALADDQGERADALAYLAHADWWRLAVDDWCATTTGTPELDQTPYYVRITDDGDPDAGHERTLANNGPTLDERAIVDAGFLELVRLGLRDPDETVIRNSLAVVDDRIRVETPNGPGWYRYNGDGYGELGADSVDEGAPWSMERNGAGRLWPIFTGERGEYELLADADGPDPTALLEAMEGFANSGRMIPEQVWDQPDETRYGWEFGEGTGSATPLAWSMAQYIRLAHSIDQGEPVEMPAILQERYRSSTPDSPSLQVESVERTEEGVTVEGRTDGDEIAVWTPDGTEKVECNGSRFSATVSPDADELAVVAATEAAELVDVGTAIERVAIDEETVQ